MSYAESWPDPASYVTPRRAALVRLDIDTERGFAARDHEDLPAVAQPVAFSAHSDIPGARVEAEPVGASPTTRTDAPTGSLAALRSSRPCWCGAIPARRHMNGWLCAAHAPVQPFVDPTRTAAALFAQRRKAFRAQAVSR